MDNQLINNPYPEDTNLLRQLLTDLLGDAEVKHLRPKALIVPQGDYMLSGKVAAAAYALLPACRHTISKVIILSSPQYSTFQGMLIPVHHNFSTPLGKVSINADLVARAMKYDTVNLWQQDYTPEPSLNIPLPFLQFCLDHFEVLPILVDDISALSAAQVITGLWDIEDTLIIVSSDLSNNHTYEDAQARDAATISAIEQLNTHLTAGQASSHSAVNGLLKAAQQKGLNITTLNFCNSGDTTDKLHQVSGFASFALQ